LKEKRDTKKKEFEKKRATEEKKSETRRKEEQKKVRCCWEHAGSVEGKLVQIGSEFFSSSFFLSCSAGLSHPCARGKAARASAKPQCPSP
jgi:hypothetical protein